MEKPAEELAKVQQLQAMQAMQEMQGLQGTMQDLGLGFQGVDVSMVGLLVEIFLRPQYESVRGAPPRESLLAGYLALGQVGVGTPQFSEVLSRITDAVRLPGLDLTR